MTFYTGSRFPAWQGDLLLGALRDRVLWRITYEGDREVNREALLASREERIRDVAQGPEGDVFVITTTGNLLRLSPRKRQHH